ncbi:MAG: ATP-dependent DNA helicase RecG [Firmicutes bacterium]|nr:ATP-dependent DNA helicase RecG [Bacillota bacterium]
MLLNEISCIKGIGSKRERLFLKLGIRTVYDMLYFFPREYQDRRSVKKISDVISGECACIEAAACTKLNSRRVRRGLSYQKVTVTDDSGVVFITWFNQNFLIKSFDENAKYIYYGKIDEKNGRLEMNSPIMVKDKKIMPIYPLTEGITQNLMVKIMQSCVAYAKYATEILPNRLREKYTLCGISYALLNIHFPKDFESFEFARNRLAFEELFLLQLGLKIMKQKRASIAATPLRNTQNISSFLKALPFTLTNAQKRTADEIISDIGKPTAANRLVQGDVGSGKTIVAAIAMMVSANSGAQSAMMVPTEILANQHYKSITEYFYGTGIKIVLLTGSLSAKEKQLAYDDIKSGKADIVIGTHALIQKGVEFKNLCLTITDEQHRFGVMQRADLTQKGTTPHRLIMTATPIPRTLSFVLYGELDISVIDELPPGRKQIETYPVDESKRERVNDFLTKQLTQGRQVYIVCPLIEENEELELKAAQQYARQLQNKVFHNFSVGLIHGRLKAAEKNYIMNRFANGEINVLVSTTVIEVGLNVPNASVMVIENAERFGLSQLHQLRGRVGRGEWKSYCILFYSGSSKTARQRLSVMKETNDGFKIAEKDLEIRGPGEFFGTQQHGLLELKIAKLCSDMNLINKSAKAADEVLAADLRLCNAENSEIRKKITQMLERIGETI